MEIQIRSTTGATTRFAMNDEQKGLGLIEALKPSEFFSQSVLRIQTGKRTSIFCMKTVESIFFATSLQANIREQPATRELRSIPETEYQEKLRILRRQYEPLEHLFEPGQDIHTLVALCCQSGQRHFLDVELIVGLRVEQLMDLHTRLGRLTCVIPCRPEGYIAINPFTIQQIEIYPAPQETPHTAWLVG